MENLKETVMKAQKGDEESFKLLYDTFYKRAYYIALKISNYCEADAQDIAQDTFMEIHRSMNKLQKPENFKAWMIRILISKCSHKFRNNRDIIVEPEKIVKMEGYQEKRNYMLPNDKLNNEEDKKILLQLLEHLKPKQKEVLVLQYFENMSIKEIAEALQIPEGTAKTRIMAAKNQLKELVLEYEEKENRKLGFQADAIGAVLAMALLMEYEGLQDKLKAAVKLKTKKQSPWKYYMAIGACCSVLAIAGIGAHNEWNKRKPTGIMSTEEKKFQPVEYQQRMIVDCRDAYYTLKEWAQNEERMALRSKEEKEKILPVYESLKEYQGIYYEKLVMSQWASTFEAK